MKLFMSVEKWVVSFTKKLYIFSEMASNASKATRQAHNIYLLGRPTEELGDKDKLPTKASVLKLLKFRQIEQKNTPLSSLLACKMKPASKNLICKEGECVVPENFDWTRCVVSEVRDIWDKAGIPTVSDHAVLDKIIKLNKTWQSFDKNKNKNKTEGQKVKEELFVADMEELFDISAKKNVKGGVVTAEDLIKSDTSRSDNSKAEDIYFLKDQREEAAMSLGKFDEEYSEKVFKKYQRQAKENLRGERENEKALDLERERKRPRLDNENNADESDPSDEDFQDVSSKLPRVPDPEKLECPKDILKKTAMVAKRWGVSPAAHADLVAAFVGESGGDLNKVSVSEGKEIILQIRP